MKAGAVKCVLDSKIYDDNDCLSDTSIILPLYPIHPNMGQQEKESFFNESSTVYVSQRLVFHIAS